MYNNKILALVNLKEFEKFSDKEWDNRGLIPSEKSLSIKLEKYFNDLLTELISVCEQKQSLHEVKKVLEYSLEKIDAKDFDTEEREFIADYSENISQILEIEINEKLNFWVYGISIDNYEQTQEKFSQKILEEERKRHEILFTECRKCKTQLETFVLERDNNIPDLNFEVVKCVKCSELNLIDNGAGIKRYRFLNYELIEELAKEEFSLENALKRLDQIKNEN